MQWIILIGVAILSFCFTYSTYSTVKDTNYYIYIAITFGVLNQFLWAIAAKAIKDKDFLYFYGNVWDFVTTAIWLFFPLFLGVTIKPSGYIGVTLIAVGIFLIKKG